MSPPRHNVRDSQAKKVVTLKTGGTGGAGGICPSPLPDFCKLVNPIQGLFCGPYPIQLDGGEGQFMERP